jgi:spermidine synthase
MLKTSMTIPHRPARFFEELDFQPTPIGDLALRRRVVAALDDTEVYEVTLGGGFLMSSLFTAVEIALADLALTGREGPLDVVVGGLGLGYTAQAALRHPSVRSLVVVEALEPVIGWHRRGLVPLGAELTADPRCRFVQADFFAAAAAPAQGFDPLTPGARWHAVLLDIDHSPRNLLDENNARFYQPSGLRALAAQLHPSGIFAMWSDDPPDETFLAALREVFPQVRAEVVSFPNPLLECESSSTVYLAERGD